MLMLSTLTTPASVLRLAVSAIGCGIDGGNWLFDSRALVPTQLPNQMWNVVFLRHSPLLFLKTLLSRKLKQLEIWRCLLLLCLNKPVPLPILVIGLQLHG
jgi:hypothetical protein